MSIAVAPASSAHAGLVPPTAVTGWSSGQNWSGYSRTDGPFSTVHGRFTVPAVSSRCGTRSAAAVYVGIGGDVPGSHKFVQAGYTLTPTINGLHGAWFELFSETATPAPVNVPFSAAVGDDVAVTVAYSASTHALHFRWANRTRHTAVTRTVTHADQWMPTGRYAVADWITERPNYPDVGSPLARIGAVRWHALWAVHHGHRVGLGAHLTRHTAVGTGGRDVATATARPWRHRFVSTWRHCS